MVQGADQDGTTCVREVGELRGPICREHHSLSRNGEAKDDGDAEEHWRGENSNLTAPLLAVNELAKPAAKKKINSVEWG
jgi:hypothetical protein